MDFVCKFKEINNSMVFYTTYINYNTCYEKCYRILTKIGCISEKLKLIWFFIRFTLSLHSDLQKGTVPDVKIERDIYETRNQKRPW